MHLRTAGPHHRIAVGVGIAAAAAVVAVVLLAPDPALAGPIRDSADRAKTEVIGAAGSVLACVLAVGAMVLFFLRQYVPMAVMLLAGSIPAYMVFSPDKATSLLSGLANTFFG